MSVHKFETLFCLDKRNKMKQWDICVETNENFSEIIVVYGCVDNRKIETRTKINKGKNIGKINETSHFQQAIKDAQSKWNKKRDLEGYVLINEVNVNKQEIKFPMLAHDYFKQKNKLKFPCFMQPKLDGYRMIYENGKCSSRQGKEFDIIKNTQLFKELQSIKENIILDGELYVHNGTFENLGILRKKKLLESDKIKLDLIEYQVYDIIDTEKEFQDRNEILTKFVNENNFKKIKLVNTIMVKNEQNIKEIHKNFIEDNYEGSIIRNADGKYRCKFRSTDLLKYKDFQDKEYPIVDFTFEKDTSGDELNLIVWICKTKDGNEFSVRPKGTHDERKSLYKECIEGNFQKYKGKNLWVKYFELTDRNIPRFPTTKTENVDSYIRDIIE